MIEVEILNMRNSKVPLKIKVSARFNIRIGGKDGWYVRFCEASKKKILDGGFWKFEDDVEEKVKAIATKIFTDFIISKYMKYVGTNQEHRMMDGSVGQFNLEKDFIRAGWNPHLFFLADYYEAWQEFERRKPDEENSE